MYHQVKLVVKYIQVSFDMFVVNSAPHFPFLRAQPVCVCALLGEREEGLNVRDGYD